MSNEAEKPLFQERQMVTLDLEESGVAQRLRTTTVRDVVTVFRVYRRGKEIDVSIGPGDPNVFLGRGDMVMDRLQARHAAKVLIRAADAIDDAFGKEGT